MSWNTIKSEKKVDFPLFKVYQDLVKLPNEQKLDYYWVDKIPVVIILPLISGKIVMVKQYRYPIRSESLEIPAGHLWPDEDPKECAIRELKEETGFTAGKIEKILEYHPSTEYSTQVYHIFVADDLKDGKTAREKYELIDMEILSPKSVIDKILNGKITCGRTITAVLLARHLDRI